MFFRKTDSLHLYFFTSPNPEYQLGGKFYPFGNDRILRAHDNRVYCNYSPIELFPQVIYTFSLVATILVLQEFPKILPPCLSVFRIL
jgi:hypothetical protein